MRIVKVFTACLGLAALGGCTLGLGARPNPAVEVPVSFDAPVPPGSAVESRPWWRGSGDARLEALVEASLLANRDLRRAQAAIAEARALRREARSARWPIVEVLGGRGRVDPLGPEGARDGATLSAEASWELDVSGRVRAEVRGARAGLRRAEAERADAARLLVAEVARAYVDLRALQAQRLSAERAIELQRDVLRITEVRAGVGEASPGEASAALSELRSTEATLPQFDADLETVLARLSLLTARPAAALAAELAAPAAVPVVAASLGAPTPAELLRARPDVRAAEAALAASDAALEASAAALWPGLFLTARGLGTGVDFDAAGTRGALDLGAQLELRLPLLNRSRLYAAVDAADARRTAALAAYEQAVIAALAETRASLIRVERLRAARDALVEAAVAGRESVRVATARYDEGEVSFLEVLITQRDQLRRELEQVRGEAALAAETVTLAQNFALPAE